MVLYLLSLAVNMEIGQVQKMFIYENIFFDFEGNVKVGLSNINQGFL